MENNFGKRNQPCFYIIGFDKFNLLSMQFRCNWDGYNKKFLEIDSIEYGSMSPKYATQFDTLEETKEIIEEIRKRYDNILISRNNLIDSIIHGNDFNPNDLKIFKVHFVMKELN